MFKEVTLKKLLICVKLKHLLFECQTSCARDFIIVKLR